MAGDFAKLKRSAWRDPDFMGLSRNAILTYFEAVGQYDMSWCGVVQYVPRRWATHGSDATVELIEAGLCELEAAGYVVWDRFTDEIWVRTFMKHDDVFKKKKDKDEYTNIASAAHKAHKEVESPNLRNLIAAAFPQDLQEQYGLTPETPSEAPDTLLLEGSKNPSPSPSTTPSEGVTEPLAKPPGIGTGVGVGEGNGEKDSSSNLEIAPPSVVEEEEEDFPRTFWDAALIVARRRFDRRSSTAEPIVDTDAWIRKVRSDLLAEHRDTAPSLWQLGMSPTELADALEPPPKPKTKPEHPLEAEVAAANRQYALNDARRDKPCPNCEGSRWIELADGNATECETCKGLGTVAA